MYKYIDTSISDVYAIYVSIYIHLYIYIYIYIYASEKVAAASFLSEHGSLFDALSGSHMGWFPELLTIKQDLVKHLLQVFDVRCGDFMKWAKKNEAWKTLPAETTIAEFEAAKIDTSHVDDWSIVVAHAQQSDYMIEASQKQLFISKILFFD